MKKYLLLLLAGLWTCAAQAKIIPGVRLGLSYNQLTQIVDEEVTYGGRIGFEAAGLLDIPLSQRFSIVPELAVASEGGAYNYLYLFDDMGIMAGPFASVSTREREHHEWISREFRRFDVGAGAGLYVEYHSVFFSVYGRTGFIDKLRQKQPFESQVYQNSVALSFGYRFY